MGNKVCSPCKQTSDLNDNKLKKVDKKQLGSY